MPEKKGDHSAAEQRIASILPLPSKIKIEIRLKNHELFKIVLHILVAGGGRKVTDQNPTVLFTALRCVKELIMSFQLCKDLSCYFILFLSLHSITSFKSLTHTSFPLCRK